PVTRAEYAALIEKVFQPQTVQTPIAFKDVPADFWATPAIDTAVKIGFLKGYPEGVFQPNQPISRAQLFASLVNGLQISQPTAPADVVKLYRDSDQIPAWAVPVVSSATQAGLVVNYPAIDALQPNRAATRAEVSAILYQALVAAGKLDPIPSDFIVRP
ncbi:MAG TPA: S-layer homology domain-containing protein, partial [Coleofasciculaceae cyanobacterium]